jgi:hypothetical protein
VTDIVPGARLKFSPDDLQDLSKGLRTVLEELEDQHAPLLENVGVWWDWYDAKPLTPQRNDPWPNASNVVVPLIRIHADAIISRRQNTIFAGNDVWMGRNRNETIKDFVKPVTDFLNWAGNDNEFDLFMPFLDWFSEAVPIGTGVLALNWTSRRQQMFLPGRGGKPRTTTVELHRGPHLEQVPRGQVLWQGDRQLQDSDIVVRQSFMTWSEIARMVGLGEWDAEAADAIKGRSTLGTGGGRSERIRSRVLAASGMRQRDPSFAQVYDIREVWVNWPLLRGLGVEDPGRHETSTATPPIVVTMHRDTGEILRVIAKPYITARWPFYETHWRKRGQRSQQGGLCKALEHMQRGTTTMVNQSIDVVTLSNSILGITDDPKLQNQVWAPNKLLLGRPESFAELKLNKLIAPDITLVTLLMGLAERLTGINDPNLGKETRLGGHPSPATSTLTLLNESQAAEKESMKAVRHVASRLAEDLATLYQQFETNEDGKLQRVLGPLDAGQAERWLFPTDQTISGNIQFDLRAISETMNPEQERNKALFVDQVTASYYSRVMQAIQVAAQAQQQGLTPLVQASVRSIEAMTESYTRVLDASEIDEIEDFVFKLQEQNSARAQSGVLQQAGGDVASRLREVANGNAGPPVPTGATGLPLATGRETSRSGLQ